MSASLRDKVVLVLGASGIVGGGAADGLLEAGAKVLAPCRSESSKRSMLAHLKHAQSPSLDAPIIDYSSELGMKHLVLYIREHPGYDGHVDHVFSCQGGSVPAGPLSTLPAAELQAALQNRVLSQALSGRYFVPLIRPKTNGCYLVATGRMGQGCPSPEWAMYTVVNAAAYGVVSALRSEYQDTRVQELRIGAIIRRDSETDHHQWPGRPSVPASQLVPLVLATFLGADNNPIVRFPKEQ